MSSLKQREEQRHLEALMGHLATPGYYTETPVPNSGSTLVAKATIVVPESNRKQGLGDNR
jgi:hypothetical protein